MKSFYRLCLALVLFLASPVLNMGAAYADELNLINVAQLKTLISTPTVKLHIFDANNNETREKMGLIPHAKPLSSAHDYAESILPQNKSDKLVFYCYNPKCLASHEAAKRAIKFGYQDVAVMSDGIAGWRDSGEVTEKFVPTV